MGTYENTLVDLAFLRRRCLSTPKTSNQMFTLPPLSQKGLSQDDFFFFSLTGCCGLFWRYGLRDTVRDLNWSDAHWRIFRNDICEFCLLSFAHRVVRTASSCCRAVCARHSSNVWVACAWQSNTWRLKEEHRLEPLHSCGWKYHELWSVQDGCSLLQQRHKFVWTSHHEKRRILIFRLHAVGLSA